MFALRINPYDKVKRGAGLNFREIGEFISVCKKGPSQILDCYEDLGRDGDSYNLYDFNCLCSGCEFHMKIGTPVDPYRYSIWNATFISKRYEYLIAPPELNWEYYVYFIHDGNNAVKIGVSNNLNKRLKSIQTGNPNKLIIAYEIPARDEDSAYRLEQELHILYRDYQMNGEWFSIWDKMIHETFKIEFKHYEDCD